MKSGVMPVLDMSDDSILAWCRRRVYPNFGLARLKNDHDPAGVRDDPKDTQCGNALTATAFADNPQGRVLFERKRNVVNRFEDTFIEMEIGLLMEKSLRNMAAFQALGFRLLLVIGCGIGRLAEFVFECADFTE